MWRAGAHQPAPRRVSWAGKHSEIKQQVTRDRMSATATRGGKQQQQHEERRRRLHIHYDVNGGISARFGIRRKASAIPTTARVRDDLTDDLTI